jgi:hypothetical protein
MTDMESDLLSEDPRNEEFILTPLKRNRGAKFEARDNSVQRAPDYQQ